jgi:hypothetical protein
LPTGKSAEKQKTKTVLNMQTADFHKVNGGSGKRKQVHYVKKRDEGWGPDGVVAQGLKGVEKQINGRGSEGDRKCARLGKEVSQGNTYICSTPQIPLNVH